MKVLIVEDDPYKLSHIQKFLTETVELGECVTARSVQSARKQLLSHKFELVILDMSLPTYDIESTESGGRPQNFGGRELLRYIRRKKLDTNCIIVTQYEEFIDDDLDLSMKGEFYPVYRGMVHFDVNRNWEKKLAAQLMEA